METTPTKEELDIVVDVDPDCLLTVIVIVIVINIFKSYNIFML